MLKFRKSRNKNTRLPSTVVLMLMTLFSCLVIFLSLTMNLSGGPFSTIAGYLFVPMQTGLNQVGHIIEQNTTGYMTVEKLREENTRLQEENESLSEQLSAMKIQQTELEEYRALLELKDKYSSFEMTGASVVAKDSGNWFTTFTIDKGKQDGIEEGMNVLCKGGLVGIVTESGANYATVRTIIDDDSNVSVMSTVTDDCFNVSGNLESYDASLTIPFSQLNDTDGNVKAGDPVVTSYISDEYHEGILLGYIASVSMDANGLTSSGYLTPVVDFEHIQNVMVVLHTKEYGGSADAAETE